MRGRALSIPLAIMALCSLACSDDPTTTSPEEKVIISGTFVHRHPDTRNNSPIWTYIAEDGLVVDWESSRDIWIETRFPEPGEQFEIRRIPTGWYHLFIIEEPINLPEPITPPTSWEEIPLKEVTKEVESPEAAPSGADPAIEDIPIENPPTEETPIEPPTPPSLGEL